MDSILTSVKKLLGIAEECEDFDADIVMYLNSVFMVLTQMGVGPKEGFAITGKEELWSQFIADPVKAAAVKAYAAMEDADYQRMGYTQTPKQQAFMKDWLRDPEEFENRMRDKDHGEWPLSRRGEFWHEEGQYGRPYGEYLEARKHYTESHSAMDKADMDKYAGEHLMSAMTAIRTIYGDADPELRKKIKADFSKLVADMPT